MKTYDICQLTGKEYDGLLLCLSFENILHYLNEIENELALSSSHGVLLIDQLLVTGNEYNRYMVCSYSNHKIDISTAENVLPNDWYRQLSIKMLQKNWNVLSNSILTDEQKENIRCGIAF